VSKAHKEVELAVHVGNQPEGLARVLATVAQYGVKVLAYCAYSEREETVVLLVTENPFDAKRALEGAGYRCKANSVVLVGATEQVAAAAQLGASLRYEGIEILYSYASSAGADRFFTVFKTADDEKAVRVLEKHSWAQRAA
jgi:hypothetical protein